MRCSWTQWWPWYYSNHVHFIEYSSLYVHTVPKKFTCVLSLTLLWILPPERSMKLTNPGPSPELPPAKALHISEGVELPGPTFELEAGQNLQKREVLASIQALADATFPVSTEELTPRPTTRVLPHYLNSLRRRVVGRKAYLPLHPFPRDPAVWQTLQWWWGYQKHQQIPHMMTIEVLHHLHSAIWHFFACSSLSVMSVLGPCMISACVGDSLTPEHNRFRALHKMLGTA